MWLHADSRAPPLILDLGCLPLSSHALSLLVDMVKEMPSRDRAERPALPGDQSLGA